jgi:hypothetical protein
MAVNKFDEIKRNSEHGISNPGVVLQPTQSIRNISISIQKTDLTRPDLTTIPLKYGGQYPCQADSKIPQGRVQIPRTPVARSCPDQNYARKLQSSPKSSKGKPPACWVAGVSPKTKTTAASVYLHPRRGRWSAQRGHLCVVRLAGCAISDSLTAHVRLQAFVEVVRAHTCHDNGDQEQQNGQDSEAGKRLASRNVVLLARGVGLVHTYELKKEVC